MDPHGVTLPVPPARPGAEPVPCAHATKGTVCLLVCLFVCRPVPCAHSTRVPVCLSGCVGACRGPFGPVLSSDVLPMLSGCVQVKIYQATAKGATEPAAAANATKAALGTMRLPLPCLTRTCRLYASLHRLRRGPSRGV